LTQRGQCTNLRSGSSIFAESEAQRVPVKCCADDSVNGLIRVFNLPHPYCWAVLAGSIHGLSYGYVCVKLG